MASTNNHTLHVIIPTSADILLPTVLQMSPHIQEIVMMLEIFDSLDTSLFELKFLFRGQIDKLDKASKIFVYHFLKM